jgi:hypothetical protein
VVVLVVPPEAGARVVDVVVKAVDVVAPVGWADTPTKSAPMITSTSDVLSGSSVGATTTGPWM